jgi:hypothetical protein
MMTSERVKRSSPVLLATCAAALVALFAAGCGNATHHPTEIAASELQEARTFPYYKIYWVGPTFEGRPLAAADGRKGYDSELGDSVYYGDCVRSKGPFGGGSCTLPLQVTTVIYRLHDNAALGPQRNLLLRGVPATSYDGGRSIELYSGRVAIDIFSDTFARARQAAFLLRPLNARGATTGPLPAPVFCPGLSGPQSVSLQHAMANLPGHACQQAAAEIAYTKSLRSRQLASRPTEREPRSARQSAQALAAS